MHSLSRRLGALALALCAPVTVAGCSSISSSTSETSASDPTASANQPSGTATASSTPTPKPAPMTSSVLPTKSEVYAQKPGDLKAGKATEGWGQAAIGYCMQKQVAGADPVFMRDFSSADGVQATAVAMNFDSKGKATAARKQIAGWYKSCAEWNRQSDKAVSVSSDDGRAVPLSDNSDDPLEKQVTATAHRIMVQGDGEEGTFEDALVLQTEERLLWVSLQFRGQDNNCSLDFGGEAFQCYLYAEAPDMAHRLMKA